MITETVYEYIKENGPSTNFQIMDKTGLTSRQTKQTTARLANKGYLHTVRISEKSRWRNVYSIKKEYVPYEYQQVQIASAFTDTTRKCNKCQEWKPFSEFHKNKIAREGINARCKDCCELFTGDSNLLVLDIINWWNGPIRAKASHWEDGPLETQCLIWDRSQSGGYKGAYYGQAVVKYHLVRVHRLALIVKLRRHIKKGMTASHLCHRPLCLNPEHLVEEDHRSNLQRSVGRRPPKTHCPRGHELTADNLVRSTWEKHGHRVCRTCHNDRQRNRLKANRDEYNDLVTGI